MSSVEELKKFKELLDAGIISEEDFEKKKKEVLSGGMQKESTEIASEGQHELTQKKPINKAARKKILISVGIIAIIVIVFFSGQKIVGNIVSQNQQSKRAAAFEAAIASIMDDYGLSDYSVKYFNNGYDVFAERFENLTKARALSCIKELESIKVDDPCGDGKISLYGLGVHPGLDIEYSYYLVTTNQAIINKVYHDGSLKAGLYCNQYGSTCIYECEN